MVTSEVVTRAVARWVGVLWAAGAMVEVAKVEACAEVEVESSAVKGWEGAEMG